MEKRPRYNLFIFLFYFGVENMLNPKIRDCLLNYSLDPQYLSMPYGSVVSRRSYKDFGSISVKLLFISEDF